MRKEYQSLIANATWELVPYHVDTIPIGNKQVFMTKLLPNVVLDKYKAKIVVIGYDQV